MKNEKKRKTITKSICWKCHKKHYGIDNPSDSCVKCYPPMNPNDIKQCKDVFQQEWKSGKVWCFGINNELTNEELKKLLGNDKWNQPFISTRSHIPQVCYYKD